MLKALIIEDEEKSAYILHQMLINLYSDIQILEIAYTLEKGIELIQKENPNLVFLDINVGSDCGFEILKKTNAQNYEIIVVTAHSAHAIEAIKSEVVDFILKPYDFNDILKAVDKAKKRLELKSSINMSISDKKEMRKLPVNTAEGLILIDFGSIIYIKADSSYSEIIQKDGRKIISSKNISYYDDLLNDPFYRIHKSYIINLDHIRKFQKGRSGSITMRDYTVLPVAPNKKQNLMDVLNIK